MTPDTIYDITVIGGGPAGMFATFYAGMQKAHVQLIESMTELGGQPNAHYPEKEIHDIAGIPHVTGKNLVDDLRIQTETFHPDIFLNETVESIEKTDDYFTLRTSKRTTFSKAIILAAGSGAFYPRQLKVPGMNADTEKYISYYINKKLVTANQTILVAGGGDSAIEMALELSKHAKQVTLVHRRDIFRAHARNIELLHDSSIKVMTPYAFESLAAKNDELQISFKEPKTDRFVTQNFDHLYVNYGVTAKHTDLCQNLQFEMQDGLFQTNQTQQTSVDGIYAIGDSSIYEGKSKLIATGFGEAPIAVNHALKNVIKNSAPFRHATSLKTAK